MGIRDLSKFIDKQDPHIVEIPKFVEKIKQESGKEEVSLAIDTNSCLCYWYWQGNNNGFCGGQWKEYEMQIQLFTTYCKKMKINPVFFFDGYDKEYLLSQKEAWYKGQEERLDDIKYFFSFFDKEISCSDIDSEVGSITQIVPHFTIHILARLGYPVIWSLGDANYDIMKFAVETPECIGILSNDSDFLAYPNGKPLFLIEHFDLGDMSQIWHKPSLLQKLGLEEEDMPVFACIMGNSMTKNYSYELQRLKWRLGGEWAQSMASLLNSFKSKHGYNLKLLQDEVLPDCQEFIFSSVVKSYILPKQKSPWLQKDTDTVENESQYSNKFGCSEIMLREAHRRSPWIYMILKYRSVKALTSYEIGIFKPQFVLYQFIRERLYGLLLGETDIENKLVEEWIGYNYKRDLQLRCPVPVIYNGSQITVNQLWEPKYPKRDKVHVFEQCLGLAGHYKSLENITTTLPEYLIVSSYLLCYMAERIKNFTEHDLKCLVECMIWCNEVSVEFIEELSSQVKPTSRGVEIASHYGRGLEILLYANIVCGDPFSRESFIPTNTLDGFLFQAIYQDPKKYCHQDTKQFRNILHDLCLHKITSYSPIDYCLKVEADISTLSLRPQGKWNFNKK